MHELNLLVKFHKLSVLFLMKTKNHSSKLQSLNYFLRFQCLFTVDEKGHGGGLALLLKEYFPSTIHTFFNRLINCWIDDHISFKNWMLTCFYGYPKIEKRFTGYELLHYVSTVNHCHGLSLEILMKYIIIMWMWWGKRSNRRIASFQDALSNCKLSNLDFSKGK